MDFPKHKPWRLKWRRKERRPQDTYISLPSYIILSPRHRRRTRDSPSSAWVSLLILTSLFLFLSANQRELFLACSRQQSLKLNEETRRRTGGSVANVLCPLNLSVLPVTHRGAVSAYRLTSHRWQTNTLRPRLGETATNVPTISEPAKIPSFRLFNHG